jgi:hypothetical protein
MDYTWHLSVVNAGQPRHESQGANQVADAASVLFNAVSWRGPELNELQWVLADADGRPTQSYAFGLLGGTPVTGDWNGDGVTKIGVFRDGNWFLDLDGNGVWDDGDLWARLGNAADRPVTGDWDGDGKTDIGIFGPAWQGDTRAIDNEPGLPDAANRRTGPGTIQGMVGRRYKNIPPDPEQATVGWRTLKRTALGKFRQDLIDHVFRYGALDAIPVIGDWNGDGVSNIGIFRDGVWYLDADGDGKWSDGDRRVEFGRPGDIPVVGDWNGDGRAKLGVYRNGTWYLDVTGSGVLDSRARVLHLGGPGDIPVVGDWTGDGITKIGVVHARPAKTNKPVASRTGVSPVIESRTGVSPVEQSATGVSPVRAGSSGVPAVPVGSTGKMPAPPAAPSPASTNAPAPTAETAPPSGGDLTGVTDSGA